MERLEVTATARAILPRVEDIFCFPKKLLQTFSLRYLSRLVVVCQNAKLLSTVLYPLPPTHWSDDLPYVTLKQVKPREPIFEQNAKRCPFHVENGIGSEGRGVL